ncbi:GntR family transcriptional regulator [Alginatibacterium sediminis]|uniref:GntR family transcriptional regulator n=1 Tax=Alginatibacterium sediminis TaxID=2164068 RepID=A0A420E6N5_9ALTE|nr:GntR family transcriptional regulator [Alginatibacterium sediminis]RKF14300.1 GntR family transcriptional regulator [Alginatibacterium sediminis]
MPNSNQRLPIYIQIGELLHREIAAGQWQVGQRLPVEAQLARQLGVAVGTLRKALAKLEQEGLLERRQGSGTYVKRPPEGGAIYQLFRLELLEGAGIPHADILSIDAQANPEIATSLGLEDNSQELWRIRRQRFINKTLVAAEEIWIDKSHDPKLEQRRLHESLYHYYRENFDFWISQVSDKVSCASAPDWVCEQLNLETASTLGLVTRESRSNRNRIEEFSITWFNPIVCQYVNRIA